MIHGFSPKKPHRQHESSPEDGSRLDASFGKKSRAASLSGNPAISLYRDPWLSVPVSRQVWPYQIIAFGVRTIFFAIFMPRITYRNNYIIKIYLWLSR
jgi:hypothetical protein